MFKKILMILSLFVLVGCSTTKVDERILTKTNTVHIEIPDALLKPCAVSEPYDKLEYIQKNSQVKEGILTDMIINLYGDLKNCNNQIQSIKDYQLAIIKKAGK